MYATIEISLKERLNTARASDSRKKKILPYSAVGFMHYYSLSFENNLI